jgi:hypothetical protein
MTPEDADRINAAISAAYNALNQRIQDDLIVVRLEGLAVRTLLKRVVAHCPELNQVAAEFDSDVEHVIADTLTRGYPQRVVDALQRDFEELRDFVRAKAAG